MDLVLKLKAVQSLQGLVPEIPDEIMLFGEVLGEPVQITSPSPELLAKIDELLYSLAEAQNGSEQPQRSAQEYVDYQASPDYTLGGLSDD